MVGGTDGRMSDGRDLQMGYDAVRAGNAMSSLQGSPRSALPTTVGSKDLFTARRTHNNVLLRNRIEGVRSETHRPRSSTSVGG